MIKPVVHYEGTPRFSVWPWSKNEDDSDIIVGHLEKVIDHPKLGRCYDVRTSTVIVPINADGKFETENTIYEPNQNS
jgi:hypothetical protein